MTTEHSSKEKRVAVINCGQVFAVMIECQTRAEADSLAQRLQSEPEVVPVEPDDFQDRVRQWAVECFGEDVANNRIERNHRFLEESLELVQSCGCTKEHAHQLVEYVYGRPSGDPFQEVGGVMVTLAALCSAQYIPLEFAAESEIERVKEKIDVIRAKQARKVKDSALPGSSHETREQPRRHFSRNKFDRHLCDTCGADYELHEKDEMGNWCPSNTGGDA